MEKYAVVIDPKKVPKEKTAEEVQGGVPSDDHNSNVPMDVEKGTEPFEKKVDDGET